MRGGACRVGSWPRALQGRSLISGGAGGGRAAAQVCIRASRLLLVLLV